MSASYSCWAVYFSSTNAVERVAADIGSLADEQNTHKSHGETTTSEQQIEYSMARISNGENQCNVCLPEPIVLFWFVDTVSQIFHCYNLYLNNAADVDVDKPDEKSIMTYVSQFMEKYTEMEMVRLTTISQVIAYGISTGVTLFHKRLTEVIICLLIETHRLLTIPLAEVQAVAWLAAEAVDNSVTTGICQGNIKSVVETNDRRTTVPEAYIRDLLFACLYCCSAALQHYENITVIYRAKVMAIPDLHSWRSF